MKKVNKNISHSKVLSLAIGYHFKIFFAIAWNIFLSHYWLYFRKTFLGDYSAMLSHKYFKARNEEWEAAASGFENGLCDLYYIINFNFHCTNYDYIFFHFHYTNPYLLPYLFYHHPNILL